MQQTDKDTENSRCGKFEIRHVMTGADVILTPEYQIALGFPEEVVKGWMRAGLAPSAWLIPDRRTAAGIVQWALEFPLYHALFIGGLFAKAQKIPVVVHRRDWADMREYLRLSLLGLTQQEMNQEGVESPVAKFLASEADYLALKRKDGTVAQIEDFLEPHYFDAEGNVRLGSLEIQSHGDNRYTFSSKSMHLGGYRLESTGPIVPPYTEPLPPASTPLMPQTFEVVMLGTGTGFDASGPCTSMLVQASGHFVLIDSGPYLKRLLDHAGVRHSQIGALVLTHAHEDHSVGLSALLEMGHRITLFTTKETASIMQRKLAILNPDALKPNQLLEDVFDVVMVEPGRSYDFHGLELRFHYTMHSIPCIGVEMSLMAEGVERRVLIVGDNNSRTNIERASGVLGETRLGELRTLYSWKGDLVLHDAGAGMIHGQASDFAGNPSDRVVCVHTCTLSPEDHQHHTLSRPSHRYTVVPESRRPRDIERRLALRALAQAFPDTAAEWLSELVEESAVLGANCGDLILKRNDQSRDVYVALGGEFGVFTGSSENVHQVATIQSGEIFGEMAAVTETPRIASVRATAPSRLLRIPSATFQRFVEKAHLRETLPDVWGKRQDLQLVPFLATATVTARNALARKSIRQRVSAGAALTPAGDDGETMFVLVKGRIQVHEGDRPLLVDGAPVLVDPGAVMGNAAPSSHRTPGTSLVAVEECEVLAIRTPDYQRVIQSSPRLLVAGLRPSADVVAF